MAVTTMYGNGYEACGPHAGIIIDMDHATGAPVPPSVRSAMTRKKVLSDDDEKIRLGCLPVEKSTKLTV